MRSSKKVAFLKNSSARLILMMFSASMAEAIYSVSDILLLSLHMEDIVNSSVCQLDKTQYQYITEANNGISKSEMLKYFLFIVSYQLLKWIIVCDFSMFCKVNNYSICFTKLWCTFGCALYCTLLLFFPDIYVVVLLVLFFPDHWSLSPVVQKPFMGEYLKNLTCIL